MKISISKEWLLKRAHLEEGLEIGAGCPGEDHPEQPNIEWARFPLKEMVKRNWFEGFSGPVSAALIDAEHLIKQFAERALSCPVVSLQRQRVRTGSNADPYALLAWQCRVLILAQSIHRNKTFRNVTLSDEWLKELVQLSRLRDGPLKARKHLHNAGIALVIEPHLTSTHLDGAALLSDQGPVIGLTLRFDRLDNFWFVLLHEIIHVKKHLRKGILEDIFDESICAASGEIKKRTSEVTANGLEAEADYLAGEALIPSQSWETALARYVQTEAAVRSFADKMNISSAIVAGRIRKETGDYSKLSNLIGNGEVRKLFPDVRFPK